MGPTAAQPTGSRVGRGVTLAVLAALLFGATTPFIKWASRDVGPLVAGALLYLGAGLESAVAAIVSRRRDGGSLRASAPRLGLIALVGASCAPALLVAGLARTDAATASLLLALEAPFTLLLARLLLREHIGRRVVAAATMIFVAAILLAGPSHAAGARGAALVAAAALAWATDNLLSRALADHDPVRVVAWKGLLGSAASAVTALALAEAAPRLLPAAVLIALGALGYGVSLQLYLRAQSLVGAGRTASVFAAGPFVGAAIALAGGAPWPGPRFVCAAALVLVGIWLHLSERHAHAHAHDEVEHEHLHTHDDRHHDHAHEVFPSGPHSHPHRHAAMTHVHEHGEDLHHRHRH
ncbi:MAG TPA: DMT family transporter [Polyangia bacterium]|nr:DMT family transporter [Polyangia bacterium]